MQAGGVAALVAAALMAAAEGLGSDSAGPTARQEYSWLGADVHNLLLGCVRDDPLAPGGVRDRDAVVRGPGLSIETCKLHTFMQARPKTNVSLVSPAHFSMTFGFLTIIKAQHFFWPRGALI